MRDWEKITNLLVRYLAVARNIDESEIPPEIAALVARDLLGDLTERFGKPILPLPGQTVAVALGQTKLAAMFFDRAWSIPAMEDRPPDDVIVYGGSSLEVLPFLMHIMEQATNADSSKFIEFVDKNGFELDPMFGVHGPAVKRISILLNRLHGISSTPVYDSDDGFSQEYQLGSNSAICTALVNIEVIDETKLSWDQVQHFRQDQQARGDLRRLRHWLDSNFVGKPIAYIEDEVAIRLELYESALKKHGVNTILGTLSDLIDKNFVLGVSGAVAGTSIAAGPTWSALVGAGLALGRASLSITQRMLNLSDRNNQEGSEVAFVHEIKKRTR